MEKFWLKLLSFLFLTISFSDCYSQQQTKVKYSKAELHSFSLPYLYQGDKIPFFYHRKLKRLKRALDYQLSDSPNDIVLLFYRSEIYHIRDEFDRMLNDYKRIMGLPESEDQGKLKLYIAGQATIYLLMKVNNGEVQYKADCCYFNSFVKASGVYRQICMLEMDPDYMCDCN